VLAHLRDRINALGRQQQHHSGEVLVWPENWHAAQLFVAMHSQWRISVEPSGRWRYWGLHYEALGPVLAELAHVQHAQPHPIVMRQLRYLEQRALHHLKSGQH
jgi:Phage related hypothetical protein (DUF1799)